MLVLALFLCGIGLWAFRVGDPAATRALEPSKRPVAPLAVELRVDEPVPLRRTDQRTVAPFTAEGAQSGPSRTGRVVIRVRREDGQPVGAWTLEVEDVVGARRRQADARRVLDSTEASIVIDVAIGSVSALCARAEGFASRTAWVRVEAESPRADVTLLLSPATTVEGQVVDEWGSPVPGIEVWFAPMFPHDGSKIDRMMLTAGAETDLLGTFHAPPLAPGRWSVLVGDRAHPIARIDDVDVAGARVQLGSVRLPRLSTLVVYVYDENGVRVTGGRVSGNGTNGGAFELVTDSTGQARAERLPAGRYRVFADAGARGRTNRVVEVPSEPSVDLNLRALKRP